MNLLQIIAATASFETLQSITVRRLMVASILALFPPVMLFLVLLVSQGTLFPVSMIICIFVFIVGQLSFLLWATPNVYSELESRGWIYLTARPYGRVGLLFGKYIAAVANGWTVCVISMTMCLMIGESMAGFEVSPARLWIGFVGLISMASISYAAVYSLIGVIFQKRAMVIAVVYAFATDMIIANVPALISKITLRYYVHGLAVSWLGIKFDRKLDPDAATYLLFPAETPGWALVLSMFVMTGLALGAATYIIRYREYVTSDES